MRYFIFLMFLPLGAVAFAETVDTSTVGGPAAKSESEFYYQPEIGGHAVTSSLVLLKRKGEVRATGDDIDSTGATVAIAYDYGFGHNNTFGAEISRGFQDDETDSGGKTTASGFQDIQLNYKGRTAPGTGFHFGTNLKISLEDRQIEDNGDSNQFTGGNKVTAYLGYQWVLPHGFFGTQLGRDLQLGKSEVEDKSSGTKLNYKLEGGELTYINAFYEAVITSKVSLGVVVEIAKQQDVKVTGDQTATLDGKSSSALTVYSPVHVGQGILIPKAEFIRADSTDYKKNRFATAGVAYRVEF